MDAAIDWLRTKGLSKAAKKADRIAAEGLVAIAVRNDGAGMTGALIELNAETDFVSRNELFQNAARKSPRSRWTSTAASTPSPRPRPRRARACPSDHRLIATIGENMPLRRSARFVVGPGAVAAYIHNAVAPNLGRIGVLVAIEGAGDQAEITDLGRKIAMHVAATAPLSLSTDDLDPAAVEKERGIFTEQALEFGKPPNVVEKMVEGRIRKFFEEVVLLKQAFVMNPDQTIEQLVAETGKALGATLTVKGFVRLALGEGVERRSDDFAAEVAAISGQS